MYGNVTTNGVTAGALAATGLTVGSWILAAVGVIFVVAGVWLLLKKNSKHRP